MNPFKPTNSMTTPGRFTRLRLFSAIAFTCVASTSVLAADEGWYLGGNLGQTTADYNEESMAQQYLGGDYTTSNPQGDGDKTGYKAYAGYQFNPHLALQAGYFDLGRFSFVSQVAPLGELKISNQAQGFSLDVVGGLPIMERWRLFGLMGVNYSEVQSDVHASPLIIVNRGSHTERSENYNLGLGVEFAASDNFSLKLEGDRYHLNDGVDGDGDVDFLSVGLLYRFGESRHHHWAAQAPPQPITPPVVYQPAPTPAPADAQICNILNIEFEVNNKTIERGEIEKLAVVGHYLQSNPNTQVTVEGHTDNVGLPADNLILSQRRAENVANYLTRNYQIASGRLTATGYGETRPVADNSTDSGKRANRRINTLISCATNITDLKIPNARISMAMLVEFDQNKSDIRPEYREDFKRVADYLRVNPRVTATVEGHAANVTPEMSETIANTRAKSVVAYLVNNFGADPQRLTTQGFGERRRTSYNSSAEGRQDNRRVNIILNFPPASGDTRHITQQKNLAHPAIKQVATQVPLNP